MPELPDHLEELVRRMVDRPEDVELEAVEEIGHYDPRRQPSEIQIDRERIDYWTARGARLSETVEKLLARMPAAGAAEAEQSA